MAGFNWSLAQGFLVAHRKASFIRTEVSPASDYILGEKNAYPRTTPTVNPPVALSIAPDIGGPTSVPAAAMVNTIPVRRPTSPARVRLGEVISNTRPTHQSYQQPPPNHPPNKRKRIRSRNQIKAKVRRDPDALRAHVDIRQHRIQPKERDEAGNAVYCVLRDLNARRLKSLPLTSLGGEPPCEGEVREAEGGDENEAADADRPLEAG
ncbi:hypothetical protein FB451DRAFT_1434363 [Mycena latifolia]|nr:hypothetical protein FB451DRAFT_1434363 [Mycena latifolia]